MYYLNRFGVLGDFYWTSQVPFGTNHPIVCLKKNVAFGCSYYRIRIITRGGALSIEGGGWVGKFLLGFSLHKIKMTADRCDLKFLWRSVDEKHLWIFQSETSVFQISPA